MIDSKAQHYTLEDLISIMKALRTPVTGCPWDLEQDFKSIAPYTIEEAYEVADAIDRNDMTSLREELGDLLFQPVYHAQMASEQGFFDLYDIIHDITAKMISRHPHVFGDETAACAEDVNSIWDRRKKAEKSIKNVEGSALDGVTIGIPALLRAQKLQKKAAKVGFEWKNIEDILAKLDEEIQELRDAIQNNGIEEQTEELGDVLFVLANVGRHLDINAEESVRRCNAKFEQRFRGIEAELRQRNQNFSDLTLGEMMEIWNRQKKK